MSDLIVRFWRGAPTDQQRFPAVLNEGLKNELSQTMKMMCTLRLNYSNHILDKYCLGFDKHLLNTDMFTGVVLTEPPQ